MINHVCTLTNETLELKNDDHIPLNVSAPFHSDLMKDSANIFSEKIKKNIFKKVSIDIISNHKLINYKKI